MCDQPKCNSLGLGKKCLSVYKLFFLVILIIGAYYFYLKIFYAGQESQSDFLNHVGFQVPFLEDGCCSGWPLTHYIFFLILGILYPECDLLIIVSGILWELFETLLSSFMKQKKPTADYTGTLQYEKWWSGSVSDIFMNILGYYTGKFIRSLFIK